MRYEWIDEYLLGKKAVTKDFQTEWEATRYLVNNKMFIMIGGDKYGEQIITFKLEPIFGKILREQYKDIVPGYYMNKEHWNSLYVKGEVPDEVVKEMADKAYLAIIATLSKKLQKEILEL